MADDGCLARADEARQTALALVHDLRLVECWSDVGRVISVGAVAYDLVVSPDIDFEVVTPAAPSISAGFRVLAALAEHPRVTKARFWNALSTTDQGLYWQIRCLDDRYQEWKVDVWTLAEDHPGPRAAWIVEPMKDALTDERRNAILYLKEARAARQARPVASIDIYRAVIAGGARTVEELEAFLGPTYTPKLTNWTPAMG